MAELENGIKRGSELDKLIKKKLSIMDNADENFIKSLEPTENAILKAVSGILNKFDIENGRLVNSDTNQQLLTALNKEITKIINDSTYTKRIEPYLREFDSITQLTLEIMDVGNGIKSTKVNPNDFKKTAIDDLVKGLTSGDAVDTNLVQPIRKYLFDAVVFGQGQQETRKGLESLISGAGGRLGILRRYAGQIARDSINQYDGQVNSAIAREYGLNAYRYVGSLVDDSRPQCVRWVTKFGGVLPFDIMEDEINWAYNNGTGMIDGPNNRITTPENFAVYRGGYNCRHTAIPFRQEKENAE